MFFISYKNKVNMSRFYKQTRVHDDACQRQSEVHVDNYVQARQLNRDVPALSQRSRYLNLLGNDIGVYPESMDGFRQSIDAHSGLVNGTQGGVVTSTKSKSTAQTRTFIGVPFIGAGQSTLSSPDTKSRLMMGEMTCQKKTCSGLSGVTIDRFTPLVPHIAANVQDPRHLIPTWPRGGQMTNVVVRNIDYMRTCGYRA